MFVYCSLDLDCKKFMETVQEVAESQHDNEENKDASNAAGLLEQLSVEDKKENEAEAKETFDAAALPPKEEEEKEPEKAAKSESESKEEPLTTST